MSVLRGLVVAILGLVLVGCGDAVTGTWKLDVDKTLARAEEMMAGESGMGAEMARSMMKSMFESANITLEMRGDKTFTLSGAMGPRQFSMTGTWEKVEGGYRMTPEDGGAAVTARIENGLLVIAPGGSSSPPMYLKKT